MGNDWSLIGNELVARSRTAFIDFVWQNNQLVQVGWNRLNGSSQQFDSTWVEASVAGWQVIATGDLNQDQKLDLLWRHNSGTMLWWVMESAVTLRQAVLLPSVADMSWQVIGTGDSNRDGQLDILWRHTASGANAWWQMGAYQAGMPNLNVQSILSVRTVDDVNWHAGGVGDVNRDGVSDIFWYHRPSGIGQWWLMDQIGQPNLGTFLTTTPIPTTYSVKGITDANEDGQLDFIFQDSWGNIHQWLMQTPSASGTIEVLQPSTFSTGFIESGWQVVGAANTSPIGAASTNIMVDAANSLVEAFQNPLNGIFQVSQSIGGTDPKDYYLFGLGGRGIFSASLTGLTADADLRLISDSNGNAQIDSGDDIVWQWERGSQGEFVRQVLEPNGYFLEVSSYDGQVTSYTLETFFQPLATNQADPLKFDIQINYGRGSDRLDAKAREAIEDAALFWERVIPYRSSNSLLPNGALAITIVTEDLNLTNGNPDTLTLAFAGPQVVSDGSRLRLQSGTATINSRKLLGLDANQLRALLIHEFSHVLGFGTLWDPLDFWAADNSGTIVKIGTRPDRTSWIDRTNQTYRADSYAGWAYGELLRVAGRTDQVIPTAVPLESQFLAHWSETVFQNESLTPVAPLPGTPAPISQLTLAALKDLGWAVNFGAAQAYQLPTTPAPTVSIDFSQLAWNSASARSLQAETVQAETVQAETKPHEAIHQGTVHNVSCGCHQHLARSAASSLPTLGSHSLAQAIGV